MTPLGHVEDADPRYVYVFWGADETCLYVGCTARLGGRLASHASQRSWWPEVVRIEVTVHPDRAAGEQAERDAIEQLQPIHNRVFTSHYPNAGGWDTRRQNPKWREHIQKQAAARRYRKSVAADTA